MVGSKHTKKMNTKLVNVRVANIRPHYDNLKDRSSERGEEVRVTNFTWCEDKKNVYIGRKGIVFVPDDKGSKSRYPTADSLWANPFKLPKGKDTEADRGLVTDQCEAHIRERLENEPELVQDLLALKGKNLR